jgi:MYXO-CTERM domain-containing protein
VADNTAVSATFNEAIATATLTPASFLLRAGVDNVTGTVSLNPAGTIATFSPSGPLADNTTFTATLTTAITDVAGNALAADHVWTFTTAAAGAVVPLPTTKDDDRWFGCAMSPSSGGNGGILGTYGPLILLALGIAFRRRVRRRKE